MKKGFILLSLLVLFSCTSYELQVGQEQQYANGSRSRISENLYKIKDNVAIKEYVYGDINLSLSFYYKTTLRLQKYTNNKVVFSVPYFAFDQSRFFRGVLFSNGKENIKINIDNVSRIEGFPNVYLTENQIKVLENILKSNLNVTARITNEKEDVDLYLTAKDKSDLLAILQYRF
ncbi:MAG: hypothetical protein ACRDA2_02275 [Cetobacterium sp.]|uniref:hypothetical protein n=1 Tax=Cetobacterium sp. TaxID=2071632 RepID=UPI003EE524B5